MTALRQISDRLRARHILYVVDACYSGYALYNRSIATDLLDEMLRKPAIQILTAGRQGDEAQEKGGHGVFTDVLLRGLAGEAFGGGKGWLALEELGVWLKQRVYTESNRKQLPQYGNLSGEGQFVFMRAGGAVGLLSVRSRVAGVTLFAGSQRLGTLQGSEPVVSELPPGTYRLRAEKRGHRTWEREVLIPEYQRVEVTIDIEPLSGEPRASFTGEDGAEMVLVPAAVRTLRHRDYAPDERRDRRLELVLDAPGQSVARGAEISNASWRSVDGKSAPPPGRSPGRARVLVRCHGLLPLGGQATADRGLVGKGRPRRGRP